MTRMGFQLRLFHSERKNMNLDIILTVGATRARTRLSIFLLGRIGHCEAANQRPAAMHHDGGASRSTNVPARRDGRHQLLGARSCPWRTQLVDADTIEALGRLFVALPQFWSKFAGSTCRSNRLAKEREAFTPIHPKSWKNSDSCLKMRINTGLPTFRSP